MTNDSAQKKPSEFRLQRYYAIIDMSGLMTPIVTGLLIWLLPNVFPWFGEREITLPFMAAVAIVNAIDIILYRKYKRKIFFEINRYSFLILFMVLIFFSGGIHSPLTFLLLFPLIVSAVDLDPQMTRRMSLMVCLYFSLLILATPMEVFNHVDVGIYFLEVLLFALLAWYMYIIVRETLRQKYESDEARRRFTRLVEVENLKNDFLSIAQHQLRTPLSGIRYAMESLRTDASISAEAKELIDSGISRVGDSLKIINDMLMTAETGAKDLGLQCAPVDLSKLVHSLVDELSYVVRHKDIALRLHVPPSLIISADQKRLGPAISNVIDNAFKYSPRGKVDIFLSENDRHQAVLVVKDNGIGISTEDMSFIFNRLYRGENAVALEPDQSGVGLYVAKHIIELHGGTVTLTSELGKGTTVTITLPM